MTPDAKRPTPVVHPAVRSPSPVQRQVRIRARRELAPGIISVWLSAPDLARRVQPGQFVQIRVRDGFEPFLRRPLSVAQRRGDRLRFVFRVVGQGTALLANSRPGDEWDILGPLGRPGPRPENRRIILAGGGIGIAPLLFLAESLANSNGIIALLGAKNRAELILREDFRRLSVPVRVATDDGSLGMKGLVTDLLEIALRDSEKLRVDAGGHGRKSTAPMIFACGPRPMLKRVKELTAEIQNPKSKIQNPIETYALWEEHMGCGTGICYGCAVKSATGDRYIRFCQEGPTLDLKAVEL